jgi:hypothetical protein
VLGQIPYGKTTAVLAGSCHGGRLVTAVAKQTPTADIILADGQKSSCYLLGPTLLTDQNVGFADAVIDPTTSAWTVDVHFNNDDFVQKVASVEVGKQIAIILDGVVQSAPTVNAGIAGRDVTIAGDFDEATARRIAARIDPSSASRTPETPTTTVFDTLDKRCEAVGPKLGFATDVAVTSTLTVAMARSAFQRAHEPVPASLANIDGAQHVALCEFTQTTLGGTTPTTVCPNGDPADVAPSSQVVLYVVDAHLMTVKLPGMQYLLPPGLTIPSVPDGPCVGLGSP